MKAIKGLVLFMSILLFAGLGMLAYGVFSQAGKVDGKGNGKPAGSVATDFGDIAVSLPAGARVEGVSVAGDRVVLRVVAAGAERFVVLDPVSGKVSGSFVLVPQENPR